MQQVWDYHNLVLIINSQLYKIKLTKLQEICYASEAVGQAPPIIGRLIYLRPRLRGNSNTATFSRLLRFGLSNSSNRHRFSEIQSNANNVNPSSGGLLISNHFNTENGTSGGGGSGSGGGSGGDQGTNIFSGQIVTGDQINSSPVSSLYSNSVQNNHAVAAAAHMSATALLQKAAQMGSTSTTNNTASLLRTFGTSSSSSAQNKPSTMAPASFGGSSSSTTGGLFGSDQNDQNHLQDLMNSFAAAGGNNSMFGGNTFGGGGGYDHQDQKLHQANSSGGGGGSMAAMNNSMGGGSDRLTRDFLGVGQIVRSVSGGFSNKQRGIIEMGSLDSENNAPPPPSSAQSFGGSPGNFQ
uniref:Uncharacterized protein n=1 Tax=Cannabis sativa TaxID=3483 RepID=A0A803Q3C9_CANSA